MRADEAIGGGRGGLISGEAVATGELRAGPRGISVGVLMTGAVLPAVLLWAGCALARSWRDDPARGRRAARRAMGKLLAGATRRGAMTAAELAAWRRLVVALWETEAAVPGAAEVARAAGEAGATWAGLWAEAEEALYSARTELPADWLARARAALERVQTPRETPVWPGRRAHWWPPVAGVLLLAAGVMNSGVTRVRAAEAGPGAPARMEKEARSYLMDTKAGAAATRAGGGESGAPAAGAATAGESAGAAGIGVAANPLEEYRAGHFAAARAGWLRIAQARPEDWGARYDLSLVATRLDKRGEAAAHAVAAWLRGPADGRVAVQLEQALAQSETVDPGLHRMLAGRWWQRGPAARAPAQWETIARAGAAAAALGLAAAVGVLYFWGAGRESGGESSRLQHPGSGEASNRPSLAGLWRRTIRRANAGRGRRGTMFAALGLALAGGAALAVSVLSIRSYGLLADGRAAMVVRAAELRSIPSDLVARQQATTFLPGTVLVVDRSFFGWDHVVAASGIAGWIRTETVLGLYRLRQEGDGTAAFTGGAAH